MSPSALSQGRLLYYTVGQVSQNGRCKQTVMGMTMENFVS